MLFGTKRFTINKNNPEMDLKKHFDQKLDVTHTLKMTFPSSLNFHAEMLYNPFGDVNAFAA